MWIRILYLFCDLWFQSLDYIFKWIFDLPLKQLYSGTEVLKNFPTKLEFFRWRVRVGPWPHWPGLAPYSSCPPDLWAASRVFGWQSWLWVAYRNAVGTKMIVTTLKPEVSAVSRMLITQQGTLESSGLRVWRDGWVQNLGFCHGAFLLQTSGLATEIMAWQS